MTITCYVQIAFLLLPAVDMIRSGKPNGSIMIYLALLAIALQCFVVVLKTFFIVKSFMKQRKDDTQGEAQRRESDVHLVQTSQA